MSYGGSTQGCGHHGPGSGPEGDPCPTGGAHSTTSSSSCHLCGYESVRHSNVLRHMKMMHDVNQTQALQCCDITFQDKAEYREHCRQVHREGHECSICQRRFSRRALLRRHQSVHTGYKEFSCPRCSYASSHKSNLERHFKTHGSDMSPLLRGGVRVRRSRTPRYAAPDSTTVTGSPSLGTQYPILRNILKVHSIKPKLSHSIESILSRKEVAPSKGPEFSIKTEFPANGDVSGIAEGSTVGGNKGPPFQGPLSIAGSNLLNHSSSSPFNWTPSYSARQDSRNQERGTQGPPEGPWRLPSWPPLTCQDLRIYANPFFIPPSHLVTTNYFYPNYANNRNAGPPL